MAYDQENYNDSRIRSFAQKVAKEKQGASFTRAGRVQVDKKGFIFKTLSYKQHYDFLDGWVLIVDREEGQVTSRKSYAGDGGALEGFEHGRLLMLKPDGSLVHSRYSIYLDRRLRHNDGGVTVKGLDFSPANIRAVLSFDTFNRFNYRTARAQTGEVWRNQLGVRFQRRVPHPGMEVSLALKRFLENDTYTKTLEIDF